MRTLKFLTYDDRKIIEKMYKSGASKQMIADAIDKNYSTIFREMSRCLPREYSADEAQKDADSKKREKYDIEINPKGKYFTYEDRVELEQMIKAGWQLISKNVCGLLQEKWRDVLGHILLRKLKRTQKKGRRINEWQEKQQ